VDVDDFGFIGVRHAFVMGDPLQFGRNHAHALDLGTGLIDIAQHMVMGLDFGGHQFQIPGKRLHRLVEFMAYTAGRFQDAFQFFFLQPVLAARFLSVKSERTVTLPVV
jgi:hypothetical protein